MQEILAVGLGGFIGSVSRYLLSGIVQSYSSGQRFPFGILIVKDLALKNKATPILENGARMKFQF